jgi:hypothetical protein
MRFNFGDNNNLQTSLPAIEGWQEAPSLAKKQVQNYGFIASCLGALLVGVLLQGEFVPRGFLPTLLVLVFTVPVHELVHAVFTPNWGLSSKTIFGVQNSKGLFMPYVYYDDEQPLWHFLLTGSAPTILLTVLPILVILVAPLNQIYRAGLGFLALFNAGIAGGDWVLLVWFSTRLDLRSYVCQKEWKLYWKTKI